MHTSPQDQLGAKTVARCEVEFLKLAARGISVISTSGDLGASDGAACGPKLTADYPSASQWTTSLGASQLAKVCMDPPSKLPSPDPASLPGLYGRL